MIDPVCLVHGKALSEHECLYCVLCFRSLSLGECNVKANGEIEDVCKQCAGKERLMDKNSDEGTDYHA
jgi:hypothetical protein